MMMKKTLLFAGLVLIALLGLPVRLSAALNADLVVAQDGTGDYTTIQSAIDAAPADLTAPFIIFIKKGTYNEKLYITKNFITLLGEDRDSTRIITAELRRIWNETHPGDDYGAATVNIRDNVTDLTLASLTIINNFAEVHPEVEKNTDHTMTIRGGSGVSRVIIINCAVIATGGDTLSLWNTAGGMFYHNQCYFEGWVDYVCPRGYCFIEDCDFFGHNNNASIWHDGSGGIDQKLVIKDSRFDGVKDFALGRYHKDAAFYLLHCRFSANMRNRDIWYADGTPYNWGKRVYYYDCHKSEGDYAWHRDNLDLASDTLQPEEVTFQWTFKNQWNPELSITGLLETAFLPVPKNYRRQVFAEAKLAWMPGRDALSHIVYFGTDSVPPKVATIAANGYDPDELEAGTTYFWRVDEITPADTIRGELWEFSTEPNAPPPAVHTPFPENGSSQENRDILLQWNVNPYVTDSFRVYFDTVPDPKKQVATTTTTQFKVLYLTRGKTYYWRVDAKNKYGVTRGPEWSFGVEQETPLTGVKAETTEGFILESLFPNPASDQVTLNYSIPGPGRVTIALYETSGKKVAVLYAGMQVPGKHTFTFRPFPGCIPATVSQTLLCALEFENQLKTVLFHYQ